MDNIQSLLALFKREVLISYRNLSDIFSILIFFLMGMVIFVLSVGPDDKVFNKINIGIIWTLILFSNTLAVKKIFQDDFDDNSIVMFHLSGLSYEIIAAVKIIVQWFYLQLPFLFAVILANILLNIEIHNQKKILISFLIGSLIITCITSISGSMNLLNKKNFAVGSLIIMIFSIPVIIFSVGYVNSIEEIAKAQLNILLGIMFFFLAISPWICGLCIKISFQNK